MSHVKVVECTFERHGEAILEILNTAIVTSTALYDYQPRTLENMVAWFSAKTAGDFPVIGIENEAGRLMGFGSYGTFRAYPAYKYTVEHSVYVHEDFRALGLGKRLVELVIEAAVRQQKHAIIGAIDASNSASLKLHEGLGFKRVGTLPQVGFKFGHWLDLALVQLTLDGPANPQDG